MKIQEIISDTSDSIWDCKNNIWITKKDEKNITYGIVFGDLIGDTYLKEFDNEESFNIGLQNHIVEKDTGCSFATEVYHIIKNGKEYIPQIH